MSCLLQKAFPDVAELLLEAPIVLPRPAEGFGVLAVGGCDQGIVAPLATGTNSVVSVGLANPGIAEKVFLSPSTVEKHVEHVMD
jgi:hypothetical protein